MSKKRICPDCKVEMNHHADKVDFGDGLEHPELVDPEFGGVLEEVYTCPHCGKTEMYRAE